MSSVDGCGAAFAWSRRLHTLTTTELRGILFKASIHRVRFLCEADPVERKFRFANIVAAPIMQFMTIAREGARFKGEFLDMHMLFSSVNFVVQGAAPNADECTFKVNDGGHESLDI